MRRALSCILIFGSFISFGQDAEEWPEHCHHLTVNSFQCKWVFIEPEHDIKGTVVSYNTIRRRCGVEWHAAVYIVKTVTDTIRVIATCDYEKKRKTGQDITFHPSKEPDFDVGISYDLDFLEKSRKNGKPVWRVNKYDEGIVTTMWGHAK